jgi:Flp pilus assembly protein TadD
MIRLFRTAAAVAGLALLAGCAGLTPMDENGLPTTAAAAAPSAPVGLESALRLGEAAAAGGDIASAVRILETAAASHPQSPEPRRALADTYFRAGAYPEAGAAWRQVRALSGGAADAELGLGRVALATGDAASAETHFRAVLAADPKNLAALNGTAVALDLRGRHAEARRHYDAVLALDPTNRQVMSNRALSAALSGDSDRAVRELDDLARGPVRVEQAAHNLALAYALAGDTRRAAEILNAELPAREAEANLAFYRTLRR